MTKQLVSDGSWAAYLCNHCGLVLKRAQPQKLQRSNIDSQDCESCHRSCTVVWGKLVSDGKDTYFVPEVVPKNPLSEEPTNPGSEKKGS